MTPPWGWGGLMRLTDYSLHPLADANTNALIGFAQVSHSMGGTDDIAGFTVWIKLKNPAEE